MDEHLVLRGNVFQLFAPLAVDLAAQLTAAGTATLIVGQFVDDRLAATVLGNRPPAVAFRTTRNGSGDVE